MAKKEGGKNRKYGRNAKRPSNANQPLRTAKNKRLKFERDKALKANPKKMRVPRGTARAKRRFGMGRKSA